MKQSQRSKRLGELIQRTLATVLLFNYRDNLLLARVNITAVEVVADLSYAKVFVCVVDETPIKTILKELQREGHNLRYSLAKKLNLRFTPRLSFFYDYSVARGQNISAIIDRAVAEDEMRKQQCGQENLKET